MSTRTSLPPAIRTVVRHCTTAGEFLTELQNLCFSQPVYCANNIVDNRWIFRGQYSTTWNLTPTAYRGSRRSSKDQVESEADDFFCFIGTCDEAGIETAEQTTNLIATLEDRSGRTARIETANFRFGANSWPLPTDLNNLALAQHNGLKTRLLDWSRDPYIAAYFAAAGAVTRSATARKKQQESPSARRLCVWALNLEPIWQLRDATADSSAIKFIHAPSSRNRRLFAQRGCFTLVQANHVPKNGIKEITLQNVLSKQLDLLNGDLDRLPYRQQMAWKKLFQTIGTAPVLRKYTLSHSKCKSLLMMLATRSISACTVYGDLEGVVKSVVEYDYWAQTSYRARKAPSF